MIRPNEWCVYQLLLRQAKLVPHTPMVRWRVSFM